MTYMTVKETSPLLQLPRNVRDRIWSHAYGSLVLHAEPACLDQKVKPSGDYSFRYYFCQELEQTVNRSKTTECCASSKNNGKRPPFFWPIVSKQFWDETIQTLYASATFKVSSSINLYMLASSHQQSVRRMRNLVARLGFGIKHHNRIWSPARCSSATHKFESLTGLTLSIGRVVEDTENYSGTRIACTHDSEGRLTGTVTRGSRLEGAVWDEYTNWFPVFLRSFQQHRLKPELTHVYLFERKKQNDGKSQEYHPKDRRWKSDAHRARRDDAVIQEDLCNELAASMRALLLGQDVNDLFPDWEAENERLLQECNY